MSAVSIEVPPVFHLCRKALRDRIVASYCAAVGKGVVAEGRIAVGGEVVALVAVDEVRVAFMYDAETLSRATRLLGAAVAAYPGRLVNV